MDVRCSRCGTEYEFDDALVSERGTTVKCTNCGHQFKVYAPGAATAAAPERWIVRKASGRELVYTSLRELQRAIVQRQVGPTDMLSRGSGQPLRALGSIAELEPFFESRPGDRPIHGGTPSTLLGISPSQAPPSQAPPSHAPGAEANDTVVDPPKFDATLRSTRATPTGGIAVDPRAHSAPQRAATPQGAPPQPGPPRAHEAEPATLPRNPPPEGAPPTAEQRGSAAAAEPTPGGRAAAPAPAPPPVEPVDPPPHQYGSAPEPHLTPTPSAVSEGYRAYDETALTDSDYVPGVPAPRRSATRWIVGVVIFGGLIFVGATVGRKSLERLSEMTQTAERPADDRVTKMLDEGRELLNEGDFEGAKERFDKASVLAENNPAVRAALARLEAARADIHWLELKLLPPDDEAARQMERKQLQARLDKVDRAVQAAMAVAPKDPAVIRARVDALRLKGQVAKARELVASLESTSSDPKTAYVLAALDLAEPSPVWSTVIDRLRTAAGVEGALSRARAALVYALASAGSITDAKAELDKIESAEVPHPLTLPLERFVERAGEDADGGATQDEGPAGTEPAGGDDGADEDGADEEAASAGDRSAETSAMDFRTLLERASSAKSAGNLAEAESLYRAAREKDPGNIEALAGLGDVAKRRGDTAKAAHFYDGVLRANPNYLPALIARADMKWAAGDRSGALEMYRRVLRQSGPGTPYGQRAQAKIQQAEAAGSPSPAEDEPGATPPATTPESGEPTPPATPEPSEPTPPADTPHIDTTDLPGFNQ